MTQPGTAQSSKPKELKTQCAPNTAPQPTLPTTQPASPQEDLPAIPLPTPTEVILPGNDFGGGRNPAVFKSQDGVMFRYCVRRLSHHSAYFTKFLRDWRINRNFEHFHGAIAIKVPAVTLRLALRLMAARHTPVLNGDVTWPNDRSVADLVYLMHRYSLRVVGRDLLKRTDLNDARQSPIAYLALAAACGEPLEDAIAATLRYGLDFPDTCERLLDECDPSIRARLEVDYRPALEKLREAHSTWMAMLRWFEYHVSYLIRQTDCVKCEYKPDEDPEVAGYPHHKHGSRWETGDQRKVLERGLMGAVWDFIAIDTMPWDEEQVNAWAAAARLDAVIRPFVVDLLLDLTQVVKPPQWNLSEGIERTLWEVLPEVVVCGDVSEGEGVAPYLSQQPLAMSPVVQVDPENNFPRGVCHQYFETGDGVIFRFSLATLAQFSTFFQDLYNQSVPGEEGLTIPLSQRIHSDGLRLAFQLLTGPAPPEARADIFWLSNKAVESIVHIIAAYDLKEVGVRLLSRAKNELWITRPPLEWYLVAKATGCDHNASLAMSAMFKYTLDQPDQAGAILDAAGSWELWALYGHLGALQEFRDRHDDWKRHLLEFELDLETDFELDHRLDECTNSLCLDCDHYLSHPEEYSNEATEKGIQSKVRRWLVSEEKPWDMDVVKTWVRTLNLSVNLSFSLETRLIRLAGLMCP
ncbi:hypothetical protein Q8F55_006085 [Vanrija albida]|uniref:BTB domain-containing protein n=1 Tax=Vanrija albida TaxID=181172 RepID=A0ABR3Q477_9TREE